MIDPATGAAIWADPLAPAGAPVDGGKPPKKSRKERKAEAAAAAAIAAGAAAGAVAGAPAPPPPGGGLAPGAAPPPPGVAPVQPGQVDPFAQPDLLGTPGDPPLSPLPPDTTDEKKPTNRRTLVLLIVLLVVVLAAGGFFLAKRKNVSTSPPAPPTTVVSPAAQDKALAVSVNLRQADLPAGWTVSSTSTGTQTPSSSTAVAAFAACLGMPTTTIDQLFGGATQTDVSATAASPIFKSPADPTIEMQSSTNVVKTAADATADAVPFTKPNFTTCFQQFSTATAAAAAPGATASVTQVTLSAPAGVASYGYVTTYTIPNQGTRVEGDAFIVGGRIETTLSPTTQGAAVPSDAFTMAYNAVVARVAADKDK
jgi:cytoskeletal protein RodZ